MTMKAKWRNNRKRSIVRAPRACALCMALASCHKRAHRRRAAAATWRRRAWPGESSSSAASAHRRPHRARTAAMAGVASPIGGAGAQRAAVAWPASLLHIFGGSAICWRRAPRMRASAAATGAQQRAGGATFSPSRKIIIFVSMVDGGSRRRGRIVWA